MSLVHHVCKEAEGLESLFLISKSNCAFANFRDEQACAAAQRKLHDSKFQSVRLVSRLRKSTVEGATGVVAPTGPAASAPITGAPESERLWELEVGEDDKERPAQSTGSADNCKEAAPAAEGGSALKDRFFILKSLTVEDLELSVRTSLWATQSHNERALNNAFESADNVYLVFSANKSGEYFGYARMASRINDDPAAAIEFAPTAPTNSEVDLPKAIPTEATESSPKGRIIDDSARGTIFWEIERDGGSSAQEEAGLGAAATAAAASEDTGSAKGGEESSGAEAKAWGKPFKLEWLSTSRLPFYRTRGLRNPWNSNREVKIARDGTELQPAVGRKLVDLFNRLQSPGPSRAAKVMAGGGMAGRGSGPVPPPPLAGFPSMRSPYQLQ